jgi:hypothetical protein
MSGCRSPSVLFIISSGNNAVKTGMGNDFRLTANYSQPEPFFSRRSQLRNNRGDIALTLSAASQPDRSLLQ